MKEGNLILISILISLFYWNCQGAALASPDTIPVSGIYTVSNNDQFANLSIKFSSTYLSIRGGCNSHTGFFSFTSDQKASIGPFISGSKNCSSGSSDQNLKDLLTSIIKATINNNSIYLSSVNTPNALVLLQSTADGSSVNLQAFIQNYSQSSGKTVNQSVLDSTANAENYLSNNTGNSNINTNTANPTNLVNKTINNANTYANTNINGNPEANLNPPKNDTPVENFTIITKNYTAPIEIVLNNASPSGSISTAINRDMNVSSNSSNNQNLKIFPSNNAPVENFTIITKNYTAPIEIVLNNASSSGSTSTAMTINNSMNVNPKSSDNQSASNNIANSSYPTSIPNVNLDALLQGIINQTKANLLAVQSTSANLTSNSANSNNNKSNPTSSANNGNMTSTSSNLNIAPTSSNSENSSNGKANVIGPGPTDSSLPPVVDLGNLQVDINLATSNNKSTIPSSTAKNVTTPSISTSSSAVALPVSAPTNTKTTDPSTNYPSTTYSSTNPLTSNVSPSSTSSYYTQLKTATATQGQNSYSSQNNLSNQNNIGQVAQNYLTVPTSNKITASNAVISNNDNYFNNNQQPTSSKITANSNNYGISNNFFAPISTSSSQMSTSTSTSSPLNSFSPESIYSTLFSTSNSIFSTAFLPAPSSSSSNLNSNLNTQIPGPQSSISSSSQNNNINSYSSNPNLDSSNNILSSSSYPPSSNSYSNPPSLYSNPKNVVSLPIYSTSTNVNSGQTTQKVVTVTTDQHTINCKAIYSIKADYKLFSSYFIISENDVYLPVLKRYLDSNYGNYLSAGVLKAGFKRYSSSAVDYQLLYETSYGTFNTIISYHPALPSNNIDLRSLAITNFDILQIDYSGCDQRNSQDQNCKVCQDGYRNFMGRCSLVLAGCTTYLTDQCAGCAYGKQLSKGICI